MGYSGVSDGLLEVCSSCRVGVGGGVEGKGVEGVVGCL